MKTSSAKAKGRQLEKDVADLFKPYFPQAHRAAQKLTGKGADVEGTPYFVECKRHERMQLYKWMTTTMDLRERSRDTRPVCIFHKQNRKPLLVTMRWDDFKRIAGLEEIE